MNFIKTGFTFIPKVFILWKKNIEGERARALNFDITVFEINIDKFYIICNSSSLSDWFE